MHMTTPAEHARADAVPASRHAIIDMTQAGMVTSWNPAAVLLYGYLEEEIVGRGANVLVPAGGQAAEAEILHRVTGGGQAERYEADRVCKDGTLITVSLTAAPVLDAGGAVVGVSVASWKAGGQEGAADQSEETIDSERRDARDVQERTDAQRRGAREAQDRIDVQADAQRRGARHTQDQIDVQVSAERRDARDAQNRAEAAQDSERRDAQALSDARRDGERPEPAEQAGDQVGGRPAASAATLATSRSGPMPSAAAPARPRTGSTCGRLLSAATPGTSRTASM